MEAFLIRISSLLLKMKHQGENISWNFYDDEKRVDIVKVPKDMNFRFRYLPVEIRPEKNELILSADKEVYMKVSVKNCFLKTFNLRCGRVKICSGHAGLYESLRKRLFFKDFQSSLWPGKKYAPAMPVIQKEIKRRKKNEKAWPVIHYLWEQNPVISWATDKVMSAFKRHEAPVLKLFGKLNDGETICILSGLIPIKRSSPYS